MSRNILLFLLASFLLGCSDMKVEQFSNTEPKLVLEDYFSGQTKAFGILLGRNGAVKRQFVVDLEGTWNGSVLTLKEDFLWSDGEKQQRVWTVKKIDEHTYEGTAPDVVGTARGRQFGSALSWSYVLRVPVGSSTYDITFDDWMYLGPDGVLINRAVMTKLGFRVGELVLSFKRAG